MVRKTSLIGIPEDVWRQPLAPTEYCRNRNEHGDPDTLWISRAAVALTLEDCKQGEGLEYVRRDVVDRVYQHRDELLENNTKVVLENRELREKLGMIEAQRTSFYPKFGKY